MSAMRDYRAPWWLPGGHLQTIWPALASRPRIARSPGYARERWRAPDGDFMDVAADEVGNGRIHGEHGCAADDELATRGQGRVRCSGLARSLLREQPPRRQRRRSHRGGPQKAAPA